MEKYERNRILRAFILKVILVIIIALLLVWIVPKIITAIKNKRETTNNNKEATEVFKKNLNNMEKVGKDYFTYDILPHIVGDKKVLTLREMYEQKLISDVKDSSGKKCDSTKSYIEVISNENDYTMKTVLYCNKKEDSKETSIKKDKPETNSNQAQETSATQSQSSNAQNQSYTGTTYREATVTKVIPGYTKIHKNSYEYMKVVIEKVPSNFTAWSDWIKYTGNNITPITCNASDINCLKEVRIKEENTCNNNNCITSKYYSTRTRTIINKETKLYAWSDWDNQQLLNSGYKYTGNWKPIE